MIGAEIRAAQAKREEFMDWIERWFGVSPDGGDGSLEFLLMLVAVAVAFVLVLGSSRRVRSSFLRLIRAIVPGTPRRH